jgi:hypothetical protein
MYRIVASLKCGKGKPDLLKERLDLWVKNFGLWCLGFVLRIDLFLG